MSDEIRFKCEICEQEFEPNPDSMIEWEIDPTRVPTEEAEGMLTPDDLQEADSEELREMKLTPEQRDIMLAGGSVKVGGCVCLKCQDEMLEEQEA